MFGIERNSSRYPLGINPAVLLAAVFLIAYPLFASDFFTFQIGRDCFGKGLIRCQ